MQNSFNLLCDKAAEQALSLLYLWPLLYLSTGLMLQVEPDRKTVTIASADLRGSIKVGSSIVAYVGEQLMILGSANVTSLKQVSSLCLALSQP